MEEQKGCPVSLDDLDYKEYCEEFNGNCELCWKAHYEEFDYDAQG
jgi:hypothetical protein